VGNKLAVSKQTRKGGSIHVLLLPYDFGKSVGFADEVPLVHASLRNMNEGDNPPFSKSVAWNRKLNDSLKPSLPFRGMSQSSMYHFINLCVKY
jgi:hypothetical protein